MKARSKMQIYRQPLQQGTVFRQILFLGRHRQEGGHSSPELTDDKLVELPSSKCKGTTSIMISKMQRRREQYCARLSIHHHNEKGSPLGRLSAKTEALQDETKKEKLRQFVMDTCCYVKETRQSPTMTKNPNDSTEHGNKKKGICRESKERNEEKEGED